MNGRFLLESLLLCSLAAGGIFLVAGSMQSFNSVEGILSSLGDFFARTGTSLLNSPGTMVTLAASSFLVLFVIGRVRSLRILR